ncbi:MAG: hypothetical protein GY835_01490 [bacterium]|nr:hypothetical protein [bacterium]
MQYATSTRGDFGLERSLLPSAESYFSARKTTLFGRGPWRSILCPFHDDTRPSLRVNMETGRYRCMVCGAKGDLIDYHMHATGLRFIDACKDLGAWREGRC